MINQQTAIAFINALNNIAAYVPPVMMQTLSGQPVIQALQMIAQGQLQYAQVGGKEMPISAAPPAAAPREAALPLATAG